MKLDGEWISTWAARSEDAEDVVTAGGVLTHRARRMRPGVFESASASANVRVEPKPLEDSALEQMGYKRLNPSTPPRMGGFAELNA